MSGLSTSITFLLPHAEAAALVERSKSVDLASILPAKDDHSLVATSRNNQMEYALRALVKVFPSDGLSYLRRWDQVHDHPPWITTIRGAELTAAIGGLRKLLATIRAQPVKASQVIYDGSDPAFEEDVKEALAAPEPKTFDDARHWYEEKRSIDEGNDAGSLISFLHAHLKLLEEASGKGVSALYALWLY